MKIRVILKICIILLFAFPVARVQAQESMMNDVSYPYLEKLLNTAKQNYPLVKIRQEQINIANNSYAQAKKSWFDLLTLSYIYSPQNTLNLAATNAYTNIFKGYQIVLGLNIGNILEKPYTIRNAKENYTIAQLEQQNYSLSIEAEVKRRYFTYIQQMALLRQRTQASIDAESVMNQAKHQFQTGVITVDTYTRATVSFSENSRAKIDAEAAVLIAKSSLEEIIGVKLEEVK